MENTTPPNEELLHLFVGRETHWDLYPARASIGTLLVCVVDLDGGAATAYAPPGTSIYGEEALEVASWRRASWPEEEPFVAGRPPERIDQLGPGEVVGEIPSRFHAWAEAETAMHVEQLTAFAGAHANAAPFATAANLLREELELARPGAFERYYEPRDRSASLTEHEGDGDYLRVKNMTPAAWGSFFLQTLTWVAAYSIYRLIRVPIDGGFSFGLTDIAVRPLWQVALGIYGHLHVLLTFAFLAWVYFHRHRAFGFIRNTLLLAGAAAALPYVLFSVDAYPRNPSFDIPASAIPTMPALHLTFALVIALSGYLLMPKRRARLLWPAYPLFVVGVLIASDVDRILATVAIAVVAAILAWAVVTWAAVHLRRGFVVARRPNTLAVRTRLRHSRLGHEFRWLQTIVIDNVTSYEPKIRSR